MQDTWVQSLGWEVLEKGMANQSSILAWRIPWIEEPGGLQSMESQSQTSLNDNTHTHTHRWADTSSWGGEAEGGWNTGSMVRVPGNEVPRVAASSFQWWDLCSRLLAPHRAQTPAPLCSFPCRAQLPRYPAQLGDAGGQGCRCPPVWHWLLLGFIF